MLAAGMSRRMGSPKQLLRWRDKMLLEHALSNVRGSRVSEIVLVLGAAADEIRSHIPGDGLNIVFNPDYRQGMGASLRAGASAVSQKARAAFVVLADQPLVQPSTLDRMIDDYEQAAPQVLIPLFRGFRGNPVLLDRSLFPELMSLSGDVGCRAIFGQHTKGIRRIQVDDPGILLDIDSTEDWKSLASSADPLQSFRTTKDLEARIERAPDAPELVVVGRDAVAQALAELARLMGFTVTIADPLFALDRFSQADRVLHRLDFSLLGNRERYVVIASRGQFDEEALEEALRSGANYTGLLANQKRAEEILRSLRERGVPPEKLSSVRAPAGLDIGAENALEIALSIMAEIISKRRKVSLAGD